jgi:hypothetical protein
LRSEAPHRVEKLLAALDLEATSRAVSLAERLQAAPYFSTGLTIARRIVVSLRKSPRTQRMSFTKFVLTGLVVAGLAVVAGPASAAARDCDLAGGTTIAATSAVRVFHLRSHHGTVVACSYKGGGRRTLGVNLDLNGNQATFTAEGGFAAVAVTNTAPSDEPRDGGVSYTSATIWSAKTNRLYDTRSSISGYRFISSFLSPAGVYAALAVPYGNALTADGVISRGATFAVEVFDPMVKPFYGPDGNAFRPIATSTTGISDLAASSSKLYWSEGGVAKSAAFAIPRG